MISIVLIIVSLYRLVLIGQLIYLISQRRGGLGEGGLGEGGVGGGGGGGEGGGGGGGGGWGRGAAGLKG